MATRSHLSHTFARVLALALLLAALPGVLRAQDTAKAPSSTAPAGTRVTRPTLSAPATVARPPASTVAQPAQQPAIVPDVAGRTVDQARRLLAAAGLEVGSVAQGTGSGTPGTIVQQQPRAGSAVAPKSTVQLWLAPEATTASQQPPVSRPPATRPSAPSAPSVVTVPRLAGRTVEDARTTLARISLQVGDVGEAAGTGAPGTIVRQSPRPGMPVVRGSSVQVWVVPARVAQQPSQTPTAPLLVRVPNVVGQPVSDARETLSGASLALGETAEAAGRGAPGTVVRQQPAAGSAMLPNSRVRVWLVPAATPAAGGQVATRPQPPAQTAVAQTRPAADSAVQNPAARNPAATVAVTTAPAAGDSAAMPLVTAPVAGDSAVAVPDVRRLALVDAQALLAAAGFTAVVDTALADSAGWTVSAQQPGPGARLASGGLVALLLDPPAAGPVAAATPPPPVAGPTQPVAEDAKKWGRLWLPLAALLLAVVFAAAVGARRMRARKQVLPVAGVSARLRMDTPARVAVEGTPFGGARLRFRMNPGRTAALVSAPGTLFVQKEEVAGD
ncbi:PASTA domain-containing protein [Longimicrobium sp.]|uniref:PASTA domain-containing protein n=1 Tax=Longimicrobium sp. TaxID=2029185 RepID=UPI003B3B0388